MLASRSSPTISSKLALALTVLLSTTTTFVLFAKVDAASGDGDDFYEYLRPKLGHFSRYDQSSPYARIYESYFANVIKINNKAMETLSTDDWRKVRPTGELCVEYLMGLTVKSYVMQRPYDVIIMDACLDWIFNDKDAKWRDEKQADVARLDTSRRNAVGRLEKDSKLREIYESTRLKDPKGVPNKLQDDLYNYLVRLLQVYNDNPQNGCHGKWLETYNDFIDLIYVGKCPDETNCKFYGLEGSDQDSYLRMIAESTREASKSCYRVMQAQMRGLMETEFEHSNSGATTLAKRLLKTQVSRQLEREKWAREMVSILQLASGIDQDTPVNLGEAVEALNKIKSGDEETVERFTNALSDYAVKIVDMKDTAGDSNGRGRFGKAMGKLCRPYTDLKMFLAETGGINTDDDESERKPFEFYTLIYSLVRVTNHESIFGVTKDQFEQEVMANRWEALYLATFACQIISTTWAELSYETNKGKFKVLLRPDASIMIADWPIEVLHARLPHMYPKSGSSSSSSSSRKSSKESSGSKSAMFGKKFKLLRPSKNQKEAEQQEPTTTVAPPPAPAPAPLPGLSAILEKPNAPPQELQRIVHKQHQVAELPTSKPAPAPAPASATSLIQPANEAARNRPSLSPETINMWKDLKGYYPKSLADNGYANHPELPDDLSGQYPKKLAPPTPRPQPKPVAPQPVFVAPARTTSKPDYSSLAGLRF